MSDETPLVLEPEEAAARHLTRRGLLAAAGAGGLAAAYGVTAARARGAAPAAWREARARRGPGRVARAARRLGLGWLERLRSGSEGGVRGGLQAVHCEDRHEAEGQNRRPQHIPGAEQHVPAGPAAGRLHLVRRLPHAVLCA